MRTIEEYNLEQQRAFAREAECQKGERFITALFPDGFAHHQMVWSRDWRWNDFFTGRFGVKTCKNCGLQRTEYLYMGY